MTDHKPASKRSLRAYRLAVNLHFAAKRLTEWRLPQERVRSLRGEVLVALDDTAMPPNGASLLREALEICDRYLAMNNG